MLQRRAARFVAKSYDRTASVGEILDQLGWKSLQSRRKEMRLCMLYKPHYGLVRGTQLIVSVNYLFGRPLIPSDFLERIGTSNFRDMRNLMSVVFGLLKMSF